MANKRETLQNKLTEYYPEADVYPFDAECLLEELAEEGYQLVKIRKHAPRPAIKVIADFLDMFYGGDEPSTYMVDIDEDVLLKDLADAGYQIVKTEGNDTNGK